MYNEIIGIIFTAIFMAAIKYEDFRKKLIKRVVPSIIILICFYFLYSYAQTQHGTFVYLIYYVPAYLWYRADRILTEMGINIVLNRILADTMIFIGLYIAAYRTFKGRFNTITDRLKKPVDIEDKQEINLKFKKISWEKYWKLFMKHARSGYTILGWETKGQFKDGIVQIPNRIRNTHIQCVGPTGTGKTSRTILPIIYQDIVISKLGVHVMDAKDDIDLLHYLYTFAKMAGKDFLYFSLVNKDGVTYNPLLLGTPEQITSKINLAVATKMTGDNAWVQSIQSGFMINAFYLFQKTGLRWNFKDLFAMLDNEKAREKVFDMVSSNGNSRDIDLFRSKIKNTEKKHLEILKSDLIPYIRGPLSPLINDYNPDITWPDVIENQKVLYTSFSVGAYPEQATAIGKMFMVDFLDVCAPRQQMHPKPATFMAVWDEFANFMFEGVLKPLTTIRSAEVSMLLCHQNRSQLSMLPEIGEAAQDTVEGNTKTKIVYQTSKDNKYFSEEYFGTHKKKERKEGVERSIFLTEGKSGQDTIEEKEVQNIDAELLRTLPMDYAAFGIQELGKVGVVNCYPFYNPDKPGQTLFKIQKYQKEEKEKTKYKGLNLEEVGY